MIFGDVEANVLIAAETYLIARVPEGPGSSSVRVATSHGTSAPMEIQLGVQIAENLNPVANPAVDAEGNIYVTYSGQRGQKVPVSLYKVTANYQVKPFVTELMNPTGLALDRPACSTSPAAMTAPFIASPRTAALSFGWKAWASPPGSPSMPSATSLSAIAAARFSRSAPTGRFLSLPPSSLPSPHTIWPSAPAGELHVAGPTTSSYDRIVRINRQGEVSLFYRGLGRPQGLAFDREGRLYVAASLNGRRGVARITPQGQAEFVLSGMGLVGLALLPTRRAVLATSSGLFTMDWNVEGLPLPV